MTFPAESVPDGAFFAPHHFIYPLYGVLTIYLLKLNDGPDAKPALIFLGAVVALVGWFHFWPYYPATGALVSLAGVLGVILGGIAHAEVPNHWRAAVVALALLSFEDWISHAFGVDTPASVAFSEYLYPVLA